MFSLFLEKIRGTNPASFQGVVMKDIPSVEDSVQVNTFLYDVHFVDGVMFGELAISLANNSTLFDYCETTVIFVIYRTSVLFLKLDVPHRLINLIIKLETWCGKWRNELGILFPKTCINSVKHCLPNLTPLGSLIQKTQKVFNNMTFSDFE